MYGFQYIHLKARGSQVGAPREGPRRAGRRGRRALLVEREGRRRDEDESRGVRDRSRSPERGGGTRTWVYGCRVRQYGYTVP